MKQIITIPIETIEEVQLYLTTEKTTLKKIKEETQADFVINGGRMDLERLQESLSGILSETSLVINTEEVVSEQSSFAKDKVEKLHSVLLIRRKTEEAEERKIKTVCLDPGHGPDTVNESPDGSFKESEFTWDMYERIRSLLERQGIRVVGTRTKYEKPSLNDRCRISNEANADFFLSIHSNAAGAGGWNEARGLIIFTSSGPDTAPRNLAAKDILKWMREASVWIRGSGLAYNPDFYVLSHTNAPANLIEYGFHTNQEETALLKDFAYRNVLARATAKGICDFLGIPYTEEGEGQAVSSWAKEAWDKAVAKGILDGTRPKDPLTREEYAVTLDRLQLI